MSYTTRTANLTATPTLRTGENDRQRYARVALNDRIRRADGSYAAGPATDDDVLSGNQSTNLVEAAKN